MPRGLDHIVHAVRDLDAAADLYRRLGFTVGARNRHPWGTHNYIVQLPEFFIELLTLAETDKLGSDGFSKLFAAFNRDFIASHEGLSMLLLESRDAAADAAAFHSAHIAASDVMKFEREGKKPDGAPVKLGFSLAFVEDKFAPDIHFATCQQHYPENFWNPAFQEHANSVTGIVGVVVVAQEPTRHLKFMENFTGAVAKTNDEGFTITTPRGVIEVTTSAALALQRLMFPAARGWRRCVSPPRMRACCKARRSLPGWPGFTPETPPSSAPRMPWARCWYSIPAEAVSGVDQGAWPLHGRAREGLIWTRNRTQPSPSAPCALAMPCRWR
jgi:catechol 2,3-dioxygenase-like lactoylglutathione lyase family enzyme